MKVVLSCRASSDLERIVSWLESDRRGLGAEFMDDFLDTVTAIEQYPEMYQQTESGIRRAGTRRSPYLLYYALSDEQADVVAIVHTSQDRDEWEVHDGDLLAAYKSCSRMPRPEMQIAC